MAKESEDSEFSFGPNSSRDGLKKFLSDSLEDSKINVTCPACGNRVEGSFKELLRGIECRCGKTVRSKEAKPPEKGKRKRQP
jgi:hypothetical protein